MGSVDLGDRVAQDVEGLLVGEGRRSVLGPTAVSQGPDGRRRPVFADDEVEDGLSFRAGCGRDDGARMAGGTVEGPSLPAEPEEKPMYRKSRLYHGDGVKESQQVVFAGEPRGPNIDDVIPLAIEWSLCFSVFFLTPGLICLIYGSIKSFHVPKPPAAAGNETTTAKPATIYVYDPNPASEDPFIFYSEPIPPATEEKRVNMMIFGIVLTAIGLILFAILVFLIILKGRRSKKNKSMTPTEPEDPPEEEPTAHHQAPPENEDTQA